MTKKSTAAQTVSHRYPHPNLKSNQFFPVLPQDIRNASEVGLRGNLKSVSIGIFSKSNFYFGNFHFLTPVILSKFLRYGMVFVALRWLVSYGGRYSKVHCSTRKTYSPLCQRKFIKPFNMTSPIHNHWNYTCLL